MSILDGMPKSVEEAKEAAVIAGTIVDQVFALMTFPPEIEKMLKLMNEGVPLRLLLDISKEMYDGLLSHACEAIECGDFEGARATLVHLHLFDPLDARVVYVLASSFQLEGQIEVAARLYVHAIARDATNMDGYLRLGECLLTAREIERAEAVFILALELGIDAGKSDDKLAYARKMMAAAEHLRMQAVA